MSPCYVYKHLSLAVLCGRILLLCHLLAFVSHSQPDYYSNANLNTTNTTVNYAQARMWTTPHVVINTTSKQWEIKPTDDVHYYAMMIKLFSQWEFNAGVPSILRFTMHETSTVNSATESSLLISFSDLAGTTYFSALLQIDGTSRFNNKITPGCDASSNPTIMLLHGDVDDIVNDDSDASLINDTRKYRSGFTDNYLNSSYDWEPSQPGSSIYFPIQFVIANYPNLNQTHVQFITPNYTQQCNFGESFPTDTNLYFAFNADLQDQELWFSAFQVELWYNYTDNPTTDPTLDPTNDPTTEPTYHPTLVPTSAPSHAPSSAPSAAPTSYPTHSITEINGLWEDDYYILDSKPWPLVYNDTLFDQGWAIFNGGGETFTPLEEYHIIEGTVAAEDPVPAKYTELAGEIVQLTTISNGSEWVGPFARYIIDSSNNAYQWLHIVRNFQCGNPGGSYLQVELKVLWCMPDAEQPFVARIVIDPNSNEPTLSPETNELTISGNSEIPTEMEVPSSYPTTLTCSPTSDSEAPTSPSAGTQDVIYQYPSIMPSDTKFQVRLTYKYTRWTYWGQHTNFKIRCRGPTYDPTMDPTSEPTTDPTVVPTTDPTSDPTMEPTTDPTIDPTKDPTADPTKDPTSVPTREPTVEPTRDPTIAPTGDPTADPTEDPTIDPTTDPTADPTRVPSSDPSGAPSSAPTTPPSAAPSLVPSFSPSLAPTYSPLTCPDYAIDYGEEYATLDGIDSAINKTEYTAATKVILGASNSTEYITQPAEALRGSFLCDNPDGCEYRCLAPAGCYEATIDCRSSTGCNIKCEGTLACGVLIIYANTNTSSMQLHIECYEQACQGSEIYISEVTSAHIHCLEESSCQDVTVHFDKISMHNNTNTSITCWVENACQDLHIIADGELTQLHMYAYSEGVILDNGYGWALTENTITCDLLSKFVQYEFGNDDQTVLEELLRAEYPNSMLPCDDVMVKCVNKGEDGNDHNFTCNMKYIFKSISEFENLHTGSISSFHDPQHCVYIALYDMVNLQCDGSCQGSPTSAPTLKPTGVPSSPPTLAPSSAPSYTPSGSPSQPPSSVPSTAPSTSPTLAPSLAPSPAPSTSPSTAPTLAPTLAPSDAPTYSPSLAPTRSPSDSGDLYDASISIVYIFINMTQDDCDWVHNYTENGAIAKMQEVIEQGYFHSYIDQYEQFQIQILKLNKMKLGSAFEVDNLYNQYNADGLREMHARSKIEHEYESYVHYISTSKDPTFWHETTISFRKYFSNPYLNFTVANASTLVSVPDDDSDSFDYTLWSLNGMLLLCLLIGLAAKFHSARGEKETIGRPVDNARWLSIVFFGLQIYDVISDINLTTEILIALSNREGDDADVESAQDGNDDNPNRFDTLQEYALLVSGILSVLFLILPYGANVWYAAKVPNSITIQKNNPARTWFEQYQSLFITLVVFSGGCYPALWLCSSNLFGIPLLNCGISKFELSILSDIRIKTTVFTENGPQLIVQMLFSYSIWEISQNTALAFTTSMMSIVASVLNYCINKDKEGQIRNVFYYFELKLKGTDARLSKAQKHYIKHRKGIKLKLAKRIVKIYGDIDIANFEVGYVTIRKDNCVIRIIQHLHEEDLIDTEIDSDALAKIEDPIKRDEEALKPFKAHCHALFLANRDEIQRIIFEHYSELKRNEFQFRYCREYPKEQTAAAVLQSKDRGKNLRDLIRQNTRNRSIDNTSGYNSLEIEDSLEEFDISDEEEEGMRLQRRFDGFNTKKKKKKKKLSGGKMAHITRYRRQFRKAFLMVVGEVDRMKETKSKYARSVVIGTAQINEFISMLKAQDVDIWVIEDVLHYGAETGLFDNKQGNGSDLDQEPVYDSQGNEITDSAQKKKIRRRNEMRALSKTIEQNPSWFVSNESGKVKEATYRIKKTKIRPKKERQFENLEPNPKWFVTTHDMDSEEESMWNTEKRKKRFESLEAHPKWFVSNNNIDNDNDEQKERPGNQDRTRTFENLPAKPSWFASHSSDNKEQKRKKKKKRKQKAKRKKGEKDDKAMELVVMEREWREKPA